MVWWRTVSPVAFTQADTTGDLLVQRRREWWFTLTVCVLDVNWSAVEDSQARGQTTPPSVEILPDCRVHDVSLRVTHVYRASCIVRV